MKNHKNLYFLVAILLLVIALPAGISLADYTPEDCADGVWEVRPNQTIYSIAAICSVSPQALIAYNNLDNPNLVLTGDILQIPPQDWVPGDATPNNPGGGSSDGDTGSSDTPPTGGTANGSVNATIGEPLYAGDGRVADIPVSVFNVNVPLLSGGRYYPNAGQYVETGATWITLIDENQNPMPHPNLNPHSLWKAIVTLDNGQIFPVYAGCIYREEVFAEGDEAISRDDDIWFHWDITYYDGWMDCGNTNAELRKPADMAPGEGGASTLTVYLVHPRTWDTEKVGTARITFVTLELYDYTGNSLGVVATRSYGN